MSKSYFPLETDKSYLYPTALIGAQNFLPAILNFLF